MAKLKTKLDQIWANLSDDDREALVSEATKLAKYTDPAKKRYGSRGRSGGDDRDPNPLDPDTSDNIPSYLEAAGVDPTER